MFFFLFFFFFFFLPTPLVQPSCLSLKRVINHQADKNVTSHSPVDLLVHHILGQRKIERTVEIDQQIGPLHVITVPPHARHPRAIHLL